MNNRVPGLLTVVTLIDALEFWWFSIICIHVDVWEIICWHIYFHCFVWGSQVIVEVHITVCLNLFNTLILNVKKPRSAHCTNVRWKMVQAHISTIKQHWNSSPHYVLRILFFIVMCSIVGWRVEGKWVIQSVSRFITWPGWSVFYHFTNFHHFPSNSIIRNTSMRASMDWE